MRKLKLLALVLILSAVLLPAPQPSWADEYDESQSNPLRVIGYLGHPIGVLLEWVVFRPFHAVVSTQAEGGGKGLDYLFGHTPHEPLFAEPQMHYDFGVSKRVPWRQPAPAKIAAPREPTSERVTVKEVVVEKSVVKEVPKIVEVEKVVFSDIAFGFDSVSLTDLGKGKAYLVAQKLKEKGDIVVVIEGHADYIGSEEYNQKLGMRRAQTVMTELGQLGIDPSRISVTTLGESKPLIDQQTDWARAVNRRVEFRVKTP